MGKVGAAFGVGLVFGPAISGALADFGFAVVARVASGLAMVNFLVGTQLLSDPPRPTNLVRSATSSRKVRRQRRVS